MSTWMQTRSGIEFEPLNPRLVQIRIEDIAHALSYICRWGGHLTRFYSVGQHSIHVSDILPDKLKLKGLLHDAQEAYIGDCVKPLKVSLKDYQKIENRLWLAICERFDIDPEFDQQIKDADNTMLCSERRDLGVPGARVCKAEKAFTPSKFKIPEMSMKKVEAKFLSEFERLTK